MIKQKHTILFFIVCLFYLLSAQPILITDTISGSQIWETEVRIQGDALIDSGANVRILANTRIIFEGYYGLRVLGELDAQGEGGTPIVFTSQDTSEGWAGIWFQKSGDPNASSSLKNCIFEYGKELDSSKSQIGGAVMIDEYPNIDISHCTFRACSASVGGALFITGGKSINLTVCNFDSNKAYWGGALYLTDTAVVTIDSCQFRRNWALGFGPIGPSGGGWGGAISLTGSSSATITECQFIDNSSAGYSSGYGGAVFVADSSSLEITSSYFKLNRAAFGGGIYVGKSSTAHVLKCKFSNNEGLGGMGFGKGGAFCSDSGAYISILTCELDSNNANARSGGYGGGVAAIGKSTIDIVRSTISNSVVSGGSPMNGRGGALYADSSTINLKSSLICGNTADTGAAITTKKSNLSLYNCTVTANPGALAEVHVSDSSKVTVVNSILWNNGTGISAFSGTIINIAYSCTKTPFVGEGNIQSSPQFFDSIGGDFSLSGRSPCINAGNPDTSGLGLKDKDLAGNERIDTSLCKRIDMGAYEYQNIVRSAEISGLVSKDTVWCTDTVRVIGDIVIADTARLRIYQGVTVLFDSAYSINVYGKIFALGAELDSIRFTTADTTINWRGIRFTQGADSSQFDFCIFEHGKAAGAHPLSAGGALYIGSNHLVSISHSNFKQNSAVVGGAIYCDNGMLTISHSRITNNAAQGYGGALYSEGGSVLVANSLVSRNIALDGAGFLVSNDGELSISNCTITANRSSAGSALGLEQGTANLVNTILWNYTQSEFTGSPTISHSCVREITPSQNNIDTYPLFVDSANNVFTIQSNSPCIDGGTLLIPGVDINGVDLAGNSRLVGNGPDMGAFEYPLKSMVKGTRFNAQGGSVISFKFYDVRGRYIGQLKSQKVMDYSDFSNSIFIIRSMENMRLKKLIKVR